MSNVLNAPMPVCLPALSPACPARPFAKKRKKNDILQCCNQIMGFAPSAVVGLNFYDPFLRPLYPKNYFCVFFRMYVCMQASYGRILIR